MAMKTLFVIVGALGMVTGQGLNSYSQNGMGNNEANPTWGSTLTPLHRRYGNCFDDGVSTPRTTKSDGSPLPNPQEVANKIFNSPRRKQALNERQVNMLHAYFGHMIVNDLGVTQDLGGGDNLAFDVPTDDRVWDKTGSGNVKMPYTRVTSGIDNGVRSPLSIGSPWIDAEPIYGGALTGSEIRSFVNGTIHLEPHWNANVNDVDSRGYPVLVDNSETSMIQVSPDIFGGPMSGCPIFKTAGPATNMDPVTMSSTVIFFREHNAWAQKFAAEDPTLTDDELFAKAKAVITAMFQRVMFYEYLPALMGVPLTPYERYDPTINPAAEPHFLNCAMVYGHSELGEFIPRVDDRMAAIPAGGLLIQDVILQPDNYLDEGLEPVMRGLASTVQGKVDAYIIDFFRGGMHQGPTRAPWRDFREERGTSVGTGHGTLDTNSRHIQRGRDVGLCGINTLRSNLPDPLPPLETWSDLTDDEDLIEDLIEVYGENPDDADFWVTGLIEEHVPGSNLGETWQYIIRDFFTRTRDGDRFWFENPENPNPVLTEELVAEIKKTSFSDIIRRNSALDNFAERAFFVPAQQLDMSASINSLVEWGIHHLDYERSELVSPYYRISWTMDEPNNVIHMMVAARTTGWVGIGFDPSLEHAMIGTDMIFGWVDDDGVGHIEDCYSAGITPPMPDDEEGGIDNLLPGWETVEEDGVTFLKFSRLLDSGDETHDHPITNDYPFYRLVYAFQAGGSDDRIYHGPTRAYAQLDLFPPKVKPTVHILEEVSSTFMAISLICSAIGVATTVTGMCWVFAKRKHIYMRLSSPIITQITLIGAGMILVSGPIFGLSEEGGDAICQMRVLLLSVGFSMCFGSLFAKTYRVSKVFQNSLKQTTVKDKQLLIIIAQLVFVDLIFVFAWIMIDAMKMESFVFDEDVLDDRIEVFSRITCDGEMYDAFVTVLLLYKMGTVLYGASLAYKTKDVAVEAANESKSIAMCINNILMFGVVVIPAVFFIDDVEGKFLVATLGIFFGCMSTIVILLSPKVAAFRNGVAAKMEATGMITTKKLNEKMTSPQPSSRESGSSDESWKQKYLETKALLDEMKAATKV